MTAESNSVSFVADDRGVHPAVARACDLVLGFLEDFEPEISKLSPRSDTAWEVEIAQCADRLTDDPQTKAQVQYAVDLNTRTLLTFGSDCARGIAHAVAGGSLFSGFVLARSLFEAIGTLRWLYEPIDEPARVLSKALLLVTKSSKDERKVAKDALKSPDNPHPEQSAQIRDENAARVQALAPIIQKLGYREQVPSRTDRVTNATQSAQMTSLPQIAYGIHSSIAHHDPMTILNAPKYEGVGPDGITYRTMHVTDLLLPPVEAISLLTYAADVISGWWTMPIDHAAAEAAIAEIAELEQEHGSEQGANRLN